MEPVSNLTPASSIERLLQEARAMVRAWRRHDAEDPSAGPFKKSEGEVLLDLQERGPQTVPQLARHRRVSRQHIQVIANRLIAAGWVVAVPNPAHLRSSLLRLTLAGSEALSTLPERSLAGCAWQGVDLEQVAAAVSLLEDIRLRLEGAPQTGGAGDDPRVGSQQHESRPGSAGTADHPVSRTQGAAQGEEALRSLEASSQTLPFPVELL
jgi:DNA-binding MarR family transcriptional regulator